MPKLDNQLVKALELAEEAKEAIDRALDSPDPDKEEMKKDIASAKALLQQAYDALEKKVVKKVVKKKK